MPFIQGEAVEIKSKYSGRIIRKRFSLRYFMVRSARNIRRTLDTAAENNEAAAVVVMRAAEQLEMNDLLRQQLLNVIHRLHQDADELREIRDDVLKYESKVM